MILTPKQRIRDEHALQAAEHRSATPEQLIERTAAALCLDADTVREVIQEQPEDATA